MHGLAVAAHPEREPTGNLAAWWSGAPRRAEHRAREGATFRLVRRSAGKTAAVLMAATICSWAGAAGAGAAITFAPCTHSTEFGCAHLAVALDPSGAYPGTITLAIRRHRAP